MSFLGRMWLSLSENCDHREFSSDSALFLPAITLSSTVWSEISFVCVYHLSNNSINIIDRHVLVSPMFILFVIVSFCFLFSFPSPWQQNHPQSSETLVSSVSPSRPDVPVLFSPRKTGYHKTVDIYSRHHTTLWLDLVPTNKNISKHRCSRTVFYKTIHKKKSKDDNSFLILN